tara:strand:+ start:3461 stop:3946 length:486 start_codon:yes stop_codon:yes gene_type:complete
MESIISLKLLMNFKLVIILMSGLLFGCLAEHSTSGSSGTSGFSQSRYVSETTKKVVFARDAGVCQCCGSSQSLEFDHITPYSCGGGGSVSNIQLLCRKCNRSKSNSCICKVHSRRVGTNCCENNVTRKTLTTSTQCTGITQKGVRCRNKTTSSNGRCHHHK